MSEIRTPGFCALCKSRCGSVFVTRGDKFISQEPDPTHPTGQSLCVKGRAAPEIVDNPQRVLYPLLRTRPKGDPDPGWRRISWDEALERTAQGLARIRGGSGAKSVVFGLTTPSGTPIADDYRWIERFINAFGSPNIANGTEICNWHKDVAHTYTFGRSIGSPDFHNTGCVVLWGHNPMATWLNNATAVAAARSRGAALIVVDPRRAGFATRADQWLRVRPGSDGALALGIAGAMIRNGWFDVDFARDWTNGPLLVRTDTMRFLRAADLAGGSFTAQDLMAWDERRQEPLAYCRASRTYAGGGRPALEASLSLELTDGQRVHCKSAFLLYRELCDRFPPDRVAAICWVGAEQVVETARILHVSRPVCYYAWSGVAQSTNATQTDRAIANLMALTGSFDAPGGNVEFALPATNDVRGDSFVAPEVRTQCIGLLRSSLGPGRQAAVSSDMLYDAILNGKPYPVRGMFGFGRNFLINDADPDRGARALATLEFFAHADLFMTPTAQFADVFLPVNTPWEREALRVGFEGSAAAARHIQMRRAVVPARGEARSDAWIVFELARRLGFADRFWDGDLDAALEYHLQPSGVTLRQLRDRPEGISVPTHTQHRRYREHGFKTWSGKVELFSEVFRDAGQAPLPEYIEPAASPITSPQEELPLVLTSAKVVQYCHGQHRNIASLRRRAPDPQISLHPETARARGIAGGDWVRLCTANGAVRMKAALDDSLDPRVVISGYGWWQSNDTLGLKALDPFSSDGANYNRLISGSCADPISGSTGLRSALCDVRPIKTAADGPHLDRTPVDTGRRTLKTRVRRLSLESPGVMSVELTGCEGCELPEFEPGAHIDLHLPGGIVRQYSVCGDPADRQVYRIGVRAVDGGVGSQFVHRELRPGTELEISEPRNNFPYQPSAHSLFVAGGIGITPLLPMMRAASRSGTRWRLFFCVRSADNAPFLEEARRLGGEVRLYESGRGTRLDAVAELGEPQPGTMLYCCGPERLMAAVEEATSAWPEGSVHFEWFKPRARAADEQSNAFNLVCAKSGVTVFVPADKSILEALTDAGIHLPSSCEAGVCGSCEARVIEGEVDHRDSVLSKAERVANSIILTCVSRARGTRLVLDL